jgi:SNF2 family DNA or RNA helicase
MGKLFLFPICVFRPDVASTEIGVDDDDEDEDDEDEDGDSDDLFEDTPSKSKGQDRGRHHPLAGKDALDAREICHVSLSRFTNILKPFMTGKIIKLLEDAQQRNTNNVRDEDKPPIEQPHTLAGTCKMRNYQVDGLTWIVNQYDKRINSILADEMGLGKTIQSISFIAHIMHVKKD